MDTQPTTQHLHSIFYYIGGSGAGVSILWWLVKRLVSDKVTAAKQAWTDVVKKVDVIVDTTRIQAENHLCTIQNESIKQTTLLQDLVKEQAETNGFLKAIVELKR